MSRSRKRTPIIAHTRAESDKPYKRQEHRRERRAAAVALLSGKDQPSPREFGDEWNAPKDGKQYWPDKRAYRK